MNCTRSIDSKAPYTLHFDGSHINQTKKAGAGCIIRDNGGELFIAAAYDLTKTNLLSFNVAIAEAFGLLNGLILAKQYNLKLKLVKGDSTEVIGHVLCDARRQPPPPLSGIIAEIKSLINLDITDIKIIDRSDNKVADKFASLGSAGLDDYAKIFRKDDIDELPKVVELINQEKEEVSRSFTKKRNDDGAESSMGKNIVIAAGAGAVAVAGMYKWGVPNKLRNGDTSSDFVNQLRKISTVFQDVQKILRED